MKKQSEASRFKIEQMQLSKLKPHPRNYRTHPDDQIEHLMQSIREHGFYRNVVAARDYTILAGHGVVEAAGKMGAKTVPGFRLDLDPDDPRALKILAGDNEVGHLGERDDRMLSEMLKEINVDVGLLGTGFDEMMLANLAMVTRPESEVKDFDAATEWVGMPEFEGLEWPERLIISFRSKEDRAKFVEEFGIECMRAAADSRNWSATWPVKKRRDLESVMIED